MSWRGKNLAAERQQAMERQLKELTAAVHALQAQVAALTQPAKASVEPEADSGFAAAEGGAVDLKPETAVALTAAAAAFLGKRARIRSAKLVPAAQENTGSWAQQGRVIVQTSHNLRTRG